MSKEQTKIYLDRDQCDQFLIEYFDTCNACLPASTILNSKRNGYDSKHREFLEPLGNSLVLLAREGKVSTETSWDAPGWYRVQGVQSQ